MYAVQCRFNITFHLYLSKAPLYLSIIWGALFFSADFLALRLSFRINTIAMITKIRSTMFHEVIAQRHTK